MPRNFEGRISRLPARARASAAAGAAPESAEKGRGASRSALPAGRRAAGSVGGAWALSGGGREAGRGNRPRRGRVLFAGRVRDGTRGGARPAARRARARPVRRARRQKWADRRAAERPGLSAFQRDRVFPRAHPARQPRAAGRRERLCNLRFGGSAGARPARVFRPRAGGRALLRRGHVPPRPGSRVPVEPGRARGLRRAPDGDSERRGAHGAPRRKAGVFHVHVQPAGKRGNRAGISARASRFRAGRLRSAQRRRVAGRLPAPVAAPHRGRGAFSGALHPERGGNLRSKRLPVRSPRVGRKQTRRVRNVLRPRANQRRRAVRSPRGRGKRTHRVRNVPRPRAARSPRVGGKRTRRIRNVLRPRANQ